MDSALRRKLAGVLTTFALAHGGSLRKSRRDPQGGVKKRIVVEEDPKAKDAQPAMSPDVRLDELLPPRARLMKSRTGNQGFLPSQRRSLRPPHTQKQHSPRQADSDFARRPASACLRRSGTRDSGRFGELQPVSVLDVKRVEYFEEIAMAEANTLLSYKPYGTVGGPEGWSIRTQLLAAEHLMQAALRYPRLCSRAWHPHAKRLGRGSQTARRTAPRRAVASVEIRGADERLAFHARNQQPVDARLPERHRRCRASGFGTRTGSSVPACIRKAHRPREGANCSTSSNYATPEAAANRLKPFARDQRGRPATRVSRTLTKKNAGDKKAASPALGEAIALDPTMPELRELQRELKVGYQTLYVGVRDYPGEDVAEHRTA